MGANGVVECTCMLLHWFSFPFPTKVNSILLHKALPKVSASVCAYIGELESLEAGVSLYLCAGKSYSTSWLCKCEAANITGKLCLRVVIPIEFVSSVRLFSSFLDEVHNLAC